MRVLVTGAGGFLGGAIARRLAAAGAHPVIASTRRRIAAIDGPWFDLEDRDATVQAMAEVRPDVVVHAAGRTRGAPAELFASNVLATGNLVAALAETAPAAAILLLGSAAQYGPDQPDRPRSEDDPGLPMDVYGLSKAAAEACAFAEARRSGVRVTALRLFNVIGDRPHGEQVFAHLLRKAAAAARAGPPPWRVTMGPLSAVRDFVALDDALTAVERVIDRGAWGEPINVCTGVGRPARALADALADALQGALVIEEQAGEAGVARCVGDPARCETRLGLRASADLTAVVRRAAEWIEQQARAHARPGA